MPQNGINNLIPTTMRSKEETRELGRKGGVQSGIARRKKKTMRETLQMIMELRVANPQVKQVMEDNKVKKSEQTNQTALMMKLVEDTMKTGDLERFDKILEILGQKPLGQEIPMYANSQTSQTTNAFLSALGERKNSFDDEEKEENITNE